MISPFDPRPDTPDGPTHLVLDNTADECSLWPASAPVPDGWTVRFGPAAHDRCAAYADARRAPGAAS